MRRRFRGKIQFSRRLEFRVKDIAPVMHHSRHCTMGMHWEGQGKVSGNNTAKRTKFILVLYVVLSLSHVYFDADPCNSWLQPPSFSWRINYQKKRQLQGRSSEPGVSGCLQGLLPYPRPLATHQGAGRDQRSWACLLLTCGTKQTVHNGYNFKYWEWHLAIPTPVCSQTTHQFTLLLLSISTCKSKLFFVSD